MVVAQERHLQRPVRASVLARWTIERLKLQEIGQDVAKAPAMRPRRLPVVEVLVLATSEKIKPLIELEPPSTRPRGQTMARPAVPCDGSVGNSREKRAS